jgi:hypothetical protein
MSSVRQRLDERAETAQRQLIVSGDGSYTNKAVLRKLPPRTTFIGPIRKDAKLHLPLPERDGAVGRPRLYGPQAPTPEQILQDDSIPVVKVHCFAGGQMREIPVKVVGPVYWRKAGVAVTILLVVIKPLGYRLPPTRFSHPHGCESGSAGAQSPGREPLAAVSSGVL